MRIEQLTITTTMPQIQMETVYPQVHVDKKAPEVFIDIDYPTVEIDQSAAKEELGVLGIYSFARDRRHVAQMNLHTAIANWVQAGDRLREIETGITVGQLIKEQGAYKWPELTIEARPKTRPKIKVNGQLDIEVMAGEVKLYTRLGQVRLAVQHGNVDIRL